jgi:chromosome partitioning protein
MKIGVTNLKGGVGKTTVSINLAVCYAHSGYKVCIVDTDTNQNSLQWRGVRDESLPKVLIVGTTEPKALTKTVNDLSSDYEIIIMDGTPNLSEMNSRVILSSDILLIPTRPGAHDFRAMNEFFNHLNKAKSLKEDIATYFVINEYDERVKSMKNIKDYLKQEYETTILDAVLKSRIAYVDSAINGTGVYEHNDAKAKAEIIALANEVITLYDSIK